MSNRDIAIFDEAAESKFTRKVRESPFMIIGLAGLVAACGIGAYKFKNKGATSTSVFLMQLRVVAQGMVIGSLTVGMALTMINEYVLKKKPE